jgi:trigger factor
MNNRPPIPEEIKREVRRRCGFGCVLCGMPLHEYEHMLGWSNVQRHVAEELTLLCRLHHGEKTDGLLPMEKVVVANKNPYNRRMGVSRKHLLHYSGQSVKCRVSDSCFEYTNLPNGSFVAPIVIDGLPIVGFRREQDELLLNFIAFNEVNRPVLQILDNELIYDTSQWDIEWIGQKLTIREGRGRIVLQLVFLPPSEIIISKGRIMRNGIELLIGKDYIYNTNNFNLFGSVSTVDCAVGLSIGEPPANGSAAIVVSGISRYNFDRKAARQFLRKHLKERRMNHVV